MEIGGVTIDIGLGSIVTKDIPDNSVAVGFPAKVIKTIGEYEEKCKSELVYTKSLKPKENIFTKKFII